MCIKMKQNRITYKLYASYTVFILRPIIHACNYTVCCSMSYKLVNEHDDDDGDDDDDHVGDAIC